MHQFAGVQSIRLFCAEFSNEVEAVFEGWWMTDNSNSKNVFW